MNSSRPHLLFLVCILSIGFIFTGCSQESEYEKMVRKELNKGVNKDSLFLGYHLGMDRDRFYNYSWELNRQKKIKEGSGNVSVQYKLEDELPHKATMNFYPEFSDKKISKMRVTFSYDSWAPWNKRLGADSLIIDVKKLMVQWYGEGFIEVHPPDIGSSYVKVDGNRELLLYKANDDMTVHAIFRDLRAEGKNPLLITE